MDALRDPGRLERALDRIAKDRRSGASELALAAVRLLAGARPARGVSAQAYVGAVRRLAQRIGRLRPTMIPIESVVARLLVVFDEESGGLDGSAADRRAALKRAANRFVIELQETGGAVARQFQATFSGLRRPIVISYSSRVLGAIAALDHPHVTVCESRPRMEGRRTAVLLHEQGARVSLITDAQIALVMPDCDSVVLGCDAILLDGSVVNKSGSFPLSVIAREWKRPVIVVGDTFKIGDRPKEPLESQPATQVWSGAPRGIAVRNTVFEVVPARLIDSVVLENGVFEPDQVRSVWERIRTLRRPA